MRIRIAVLSVIALMTFDITALKGEDMQFGTGRINIEYVAANAVRIRYTEHQYGEPYPELIYVKNKAKAKCRIKVLADPKTMTVSIKDHYGNTVFTATSHKLSPHTIAGITTYDAQLEFHSGNTVKDVNTTKDYQFGLGQFQDGYSNIYGLTRRLTQVNTQISIPMLISNKGYGILWNNYGLTEFNPASDSIAMLKRGGAGEREVVEVTSTTGGKTEVRELNVFYATVNINEPGYYALLLDVGQKMARRHNLKIDGKTVIEMKNRWLPPTASKNVWLDKGQHLLEAELTDGDRPMIYYRKINDKTTFRSPVAQAVDYIVFVGSPDDIVSSYRDITGGTPLMPKWAMGYIHCRERFHSQQELLNVASRFRKEQIPLDIIVQDWQYWGKNGWNAMIFDKDLYPDPRLMTDSLHSKNIKMMLSVWSKIDKRSEVGKQMESNRYFIPGTEWIDFFNPLAAEAYWKNFSQRLLPVGIDAWWQDATEPENDDLAGRRIWNNKYPGEVFRNVYPLMVNKTVYRGLLDDQPHKRPMILTRSGFTGIQQYGTALWSGDVGNDWETLRRQITAGLGIQAAGIPWWTYDAGGFFRPNNQYSDSSYIERMLRWIETAVYMPLMRVHGFRSETEPWKYGKRASNIFCECINRRYRLLPYIYSWAAEITFNGGTMMRPLVFDFSHDTLALQQKHEYMFGKSLLISPVTEAGVTEWNTYLPDNAAGWYDLYSGRKYEGGQTVTTTVTDFDIPVFAKAGSIIPYGPDRQYTDEPTNSPLQITIYPGDDASFTLYDDDGNTNNYKQGQCSRIMLHWDDSANKLTIGKRNGRFEGMAESIKFKVTVINGKEKDIVYDGNKTELIL